MGSESGLAVGNAWSSGCTKLRDGGGGGGGKDVLSNCGNVVSNDKFKGHMSGLGLCEGESEDHMRLESCDGRLGAVNGGPVDLGGEFWSWCRLG